MTEAKNRQLWDHTASLVAAMVACVTGKETSPESFHPFRKKTRVPDFVLTGKQGIALLKRMYGGGRG